MIKFNSEDIVRGKKEIKIGNSRVVWNGKSKRYRNKKQNLKTVSVVNVVCYRYVHSKFRNSFATGLNTGLETKFWIKIQDLDPGFLSNILSVIPFFKKGVEICHGDEWW